ncbi:putative RNA polymerase sigma factor [Janibacter sp. HTCC2649]|nr:putative RNA polymerase sigma factor [Janibacter sp. HTCC2649]
MGGDVKTSERADVEFTAFVEGAQPRLSRVAVLLTGNRATAEDLLQEAFIRTYLHWGKVRPEGAYSYTRRILVNLNTDRWRRRHLEPVVGDIGDDHVSAAASRGYATVDHRDSIVHELAGLSDRERTIVVLRYYLDLSERQVAEELDISVGTVKSTCSRAIARLGTQRVGEGRLS